MIARALRGSSGLGEPPPKLDCMAARVDAQFFFQRPAGLSEEKLALGFYSLDSI